jgi:hypothetical protein
MPTVYSSTGTQWPLLQSKTEQKFKSGLFNVSAEFIRPVGNTDLPSVIETSIGEVDVWPEPTVSVGTDGFERVNATGYGQFSSLGEIIYGYEVFELRAIYATYEPCLNPNGCGEDSNGIEISCGTYGPGIERISRPLRLIKQSALVKRIGSEIPGPPPLKVFRLNNTEVTALSPHDFGILLSQFNYSGQFAPFVVSRTSIMSTLKKNEYGDISETEVLYTLDVPNIILGEYYRIFSPDACNPVE